jgi:hypothetical protein
MLPNEKLVNISRKPRRPRGSTHSISNVKIEPPNTESTPIRPKNEEDEEKLVERPSIQRSRSRNGQFQK